MAIFFFAIPGCNLWPRARSYYTRFVVDDNSIRTRAVFTLRTHTTWSLYDVVNATRVRVSNVVQSDVRYAARRRVILVAAECGSREILDDDPAAAVSVVIAVRSIRLCSKRFCYSQSGRFFLCPNRHPWIDYFSQVIKKKKKSSST